MRNVTERRYEGDPQPRAYEVSNHLVVVAPIVHPWGKPGARAHAPEIRGAGSAFAGGDPSLLGERADRDRAGACQPMPLRQKEDKVLVEQGGVIEGPGPRMGHQVVPEHQREVQLSHLKLRYEFSWLTLVQGNLDVGMVLCIRRQHHRQQPLARGGKAADPKPSGRPLEDIADVVFEGAEGGQRLAGALRDEFARRSGADAVRVALEQ